MGVPNLGAAASCSSPTALVLLHSHAPVFTTMRSALAGLLRLGGTPGAPLPLERYVQHILHEVPLPPRGVASVGFTLGDTHVLLGRPPSNELPLLDLPMAPLFQCLDMHNLLTRVHGRAD